MADFTRIFSLGELPERFTAGDACARRAQAAAAACARPGVACRAVYEAALDGRGGRGLEAHFMGYGPSQVRFVGHGVGLELDELPVLSGNDLAARGGHGVRPRAQVRLSRPRRDRHREHLGGHRATASSA